MADEKYQISIFPAYRDLVKPVRRLSIGSLGCVSIFETANKKPLWLLVPALCVWLLLRRPISDIDIFWQLRLGDMMLDSGLLIRREPFSTLHLGEPLVPLSALAQIILAGLRRWGGWGAVHVIDAVVWTGGFVAAGWAAWRRGMGAGFLALVLGLTLYMALPFSGVRPQSFAVFGLGLLILLLQSETRLGWQILTGALLLVLWQNLHPSVSVAAVYLGALATWRWWQHYRKAQSAPWRESALTLIALLAQFATPAVADILAVSAQNLRLSQTMRVTEWLGLFDAGLRGYLPLFMLLNALLFALLWLRRKAVDGARLIAALPFLALSFFSSRFLLFWALAVIPAFASGQRHETQRQLAMPAYLGALALAILAAGQTTIGQLGQTVPRSGIMALKTAGVNGTLYSSFTLAGPALDAGWPDWHTVYDSRYYRFTPAEWQAYHATMQSGKIPMPSPAAWLLDPALDGPLIATLRRDSGHWREVANGTFIPVNGVSARR